MDAEGEGPQALRSKLTAETTIDNLKKNGDFMDGCLQRSAEFL
jgi:hypothetical protein